MRFVRQIVQSDGRRLKNVALPSDPWFAYLGDHPSPFYGRRCISGQGATADEAVLAAIPSDIRAALRRLESAVDSLIVSIG